MTLKSVLAQLVREAGATARTAVLIAAVLSGGTLTGTAQTGGPVGFWEQSRERVDAMLRNVPGSDEDRFLRLREYFTYFGCTASQMEQQSIGGGASKNLVCTLPGSGPGIVVVAAHYEHEGAGEGVVEGWSGALLLPILFKSIQAQPRQHTFVFAALYGTKGVQKLLDSWTEDQRGRVKAVIALDALGLGPVQFYLFPGVVSSPDSNELYTIMTLGLSAERIAQILKHPAKTNQEPAPPSNIDDTRRFRALGIASILIHSVTRRTFAVPGSTQDSIGVIKPAAYHDNYEFVSYYLCSLDPYLQ
jgi:hypothetical protein